MAFTRRSGTSGLDVSTSVTDGVVVLSVAGTIDLLTAPAFAQHIDTALDDAAAALVVRLDDVDLLASSGLRVLIQAHRKAGDTRFLVVADGPATSRPMEITGVHRIVPLYATLDDALLALQE